MNNFKLFDLYNNKQYITSLKGIDEEIDLIINKIKSRLGKSRDDFLSATVFR